MSNGKVYLIGAGPGDPGLITVRGLELLHDCDVVVYDHLIPDELIITLPGKTEKIYVGKRASDHTLPQDEINSLLVKLARQGKTVARLKGSDPLIFGRGGEEARVLRENNISFEIVPGVTAGIATTAYSGIPCTDRDLASAVVFVTGHKAREKDSSSVAWDCIARARNITIIIYMGVAEIDNIVSNLIAGGMSARIPSAVIERGTFPTQRTYTAPLEEMPEVVRAKNIRPPAIFVVGEVVNLQKYLSWYEDRPLFGKRIMVTRPSDQAREMYKSLRDLGAEVLPYPTITTESSESEEGWQDFNKIVGYRKWIIFTSENGVRYFYRQMVSRLGDIRILGGFKIAAVGFGTARALGEISLKPDFIPSRATTESLAEEIIDKYDFQNIPVARVRGNLGDDRVERILTEAGAEVLPLQTYRTFYPGWPEGFKEKLIEYPPDIITFTSGSTVEGLCRLLDPDELDELLKGKVVVSIGPSTSDVIRSHGIEVTLEAVEHSVPGIIREILQYYNK
nr:uroporphyrinogen-III C-methyltransferase [candidate division Zixibacteria bacterium]